MRDFVSDFQPNSNLLRHMSDFQADAQKLVLGMDFPSIKEEGWKYTQLRDFSKLHFKTVNKAEGLDHRFVDDKKIDNAIELIFVNGKLLPSLFNIPGLLIKDLYEEVGNGREGADTLGLKPEFFQCLNQAFSTDGILIKVSEKLEQPIHVMHIFTNDGIAAFPTIYLKLEAHAEMELVESCISSNSEFGNLCNALWEIDLDVNAKLNYLRMDQFNLKTHSVFSTYLNILDSAEFTMFFYNSGSKISRHNTYVGIEGENANVSLNGIYLTKSQQIVDHYLSMSHLKPRSRSEQTFKGLLNDQSRMIFNSTIFVDRIAQLTQANQLNQSILLSNNAEVDTRPQLYIHADDVKCNHGASIGALNFDELFYLESRGISPERAKEILALGFLEELLTNKLASSFKNYVLNILKRDFHLMWANENA